MRSMIIRCCRYSDEDTNDNSQCTLSIHMDYAKNLNSIEDLQKKFGKLKPQKELIELALEVTDGDGNPVSVPEAGKFRFQRNELRERKLGKVNESLTTATLLPKRASGCSPVGPFLSQIPEVHQQEKNKKSLTS